jgi:hypothetical protein
MKITQQQSDLIHGFFLPDVFLYRFWVRSLIALRILNDTGSASPLIILEVSNYGFACGINISFDPARLHDGFWRILRVNPIRIVLVFG